MNTELVLQALFHEHATLRDEITGINRSQFQIAAAVGLGAVGGLGAWLTFFQRSPVVLVLLSLLALAHILLALELRLRITGLSHRLRGIERQIRVLCGTDFIMRWESEYVPTMFEAAGLSNAVLSVCMKSLRAVFLVPLVIVYVGCISIMWTIEDFHHPAVWTTALVIALIAGLIVYAYVGRGIRAALETNEEEHLKAFNSEVVPPSE